MTQLLYSVTAPVLLFERLRSGTWNAYLCASVDETTALSNALAQNPESEFCCLVAPENIYQRAILEGRGPLPIHNVNPN